MAMSIANWIEATNWSLDSLSYMLIYWDLYQLLAFGKQYFQIQFFKINMYQNLKGSNQYHHQFRYCIDGRLVTGARYFPTDWQKDLTDRWKHNQASMN